MKIFSVFVFFVLLNFTANAYWQQHTATTISVTLDDRNHILHGFEKIVYTNNSPDTLHFIYVHLWPNAYKNDRTKFCEQQVQQGKTDFYFSSEKDKGYIDSLKFFINNERVNFDSWEDNIDVAKIQLPQALEPGKSIKIETPFRVKIPKIFSRLGHNGQAYFISQWFPKPAVYDHKGWHPLPYLDQGEFFSEFGSYDVTITIPENYVVVATGNCETESENLRMDSLSKSAIPADTFYKKTYPQSSSNFKTIRFTENNIHDFAWFADKRWIVRQDSISGDRNDGITKVFTAFLPHHQKQWAKGNDILKATVLNYGTAVGKYPYKTIKAVEGDMNAGGGMEYPTITIIDKSANFDLVTVLTHEAGHNWFYGILGSNERDHPWMDEGMNSFYERKVSRIINQDAAQTAINKLDDAIYYYLVSINEDQPSELLSVNYKSTNYGADVYNKTASLMQWLEAYMGKETFEIAMKSYFAEWKFKHPYPEDFQKVMQQNTDKNLNWFFESALKTENKIDFKIQNARFKNDILFIKVRNRSEFAAPAFVSVYQNDSLISEHSIAPFLKDTVIEIVSVSNWSKVKLSSVAVDFKIANNEYRRRGLLHKNGIRLKPGFGLSRSDRNAVYFAPAINYNVYDGFGLGLLLHNLSFPQSRFQFAVAPLFSFGSNNINGAAGFSYSWFPKNVFKEIRFQTNIKSFSQGTTTLNIPDALYARYFKIAPSIEFIFKEKSKLSKVENKLLIRQYNIYEQSFNYFQNPVDSLYRPAVSGIQNTYAVLRFEHNNKRTFHPYSYNLEAQFAKNFIKLGIEGNAKIDYDVKNKSFYIRGYAGKFISTNGSSYNGRYWLNSSFSGVNDYLFDGTYFGRNKNEGLFSKQISVQEGGFKIPTNLYASPLGRTDIWLMALNLKTDLPLGKLPLRIYADFVTFANAKQLNTSQNAISFNAGLELNLFGEALSIYAPLVMSSNYGNYLSEMFPKNKFFNSLSFSLNIQKMNWLRSNEKLFKLIAQ